MRYFRLHMSDALYAKIKLWRREMEANQHTLTQFQEACRGTDCSIWTSHPEGEEAFRQILLELSFSFQEGETQQVTADE